MPHLDKIKIKNKRWRTFRAQLRDGRVLLQESSLSILLFIGIILIGSLLLHLFYTDPESGLGLSFNKAAYATFAMIFFNTILAYPDQWYLQILFFVIPVLGLAVVADGFLRFGTALVNKQDRGQKWQVAMASIYRNHVIVCGLGKVGYRVTLELLRYGRDVVGIETSEEGKFMQKIQALGVPVIIGDARRSEFLHKAGVEFADAIIPATDDQLANLEAALDAREINPGIKVVMRMFDQDFANKVEKGFGIHTAFSTSALTAPIFAAAAMRLDVKHSFYVGEELLNLSEIVITPVSKIANWPVSRLEKELDLSVIYFQSNDHKDMHPPQDQCLQVGDTILVLASIESLRELTALNTPR